MSPPLLPPDVGNKVAATAASTVTLIAGVAMHDWAVVGAGLVIGLMARWAIALSRGDPLGWAAIRVDALAIGMNGLLAVTVGQIFSLHGVKLAVDAAAFGASNTLLIAKFRAGHLKLASKWLNDEPETKVFAGPDTVTHIPAQAGPVAAQNVGPNAPQSPSEVMVKALHDRAAPADHDAGIDALVDRLDEGDRE